MEIDKEKLEQAINNELESTRFGFWEDSSFAIHVEDNIEVHIKVTKNEDDFIGEVIKELKD